MNREPIILWKGPCAYVVLENDRYDIIVHSTNYVSHVTAGSHEDGARAESVVRRLNAYPRQTRQAYGLL